MLRNFNKVKSLDMSRIINLNTSFFQDIWREWIDNWMFMARIPFGTTLNYYI